MFTKDLHTDREWEKWGQQDPYFGVITHEKFRAKNLTEESKKEFFQSGRRHVQQVLKTCRAKVSPGFQPQRVLDFGCGVGRLVIPFAELAGHVTGTDVSESMLQEARKNCAAHALDNVTLLRSDDSLACLTDTFDLIHSFIVFQHIPPRRGIAIFKRLLAHLAPGGICAVQLTYSKQAYHATNGRPPERRPALRAKIKKLLYKLCRPAGSQGNDPEMQMNPYNLNEVFFLIQALPAQKLHVEFTDHGGELGVFLYFQAA